MDNILKKLSKDRPANFSPVNETPGWPANLIGYMRADYNGQQWWHTPHHVHEALETKAGNRELDEVCYALTEHFTDLSALEDFCVEHAEDLRTGNEYALYLTGEHNDYYITVNTLPKNYNLYVFAYTKKEVDSA